MVEALPEPFAASSPFFSPPPAVSLSQPPFCRRRDVCESRPLSWVRLCVSWSWLRFGLA
jgi:hypothetical protein